MSFNSQAGQVGFGFQGSKGTPSAATRFARIRTDGLGGERALLIPEAEIGGNRDIPGAYLGPVAFNGDLEFYLRMEMAAFLLKACLGISSSTATSASNETQTITTTGVPTGGTFTLSFRGDVTAPIAFGATASVIQAAILALPSMTALGGSVVCAGGPLPTGVTCVFGGIYAGINAAPLTLKTNSLTGGTTPTVVITETTPGMPAIGTHIITPGNTSPWISIEERIGSGFESFQYTDGKVNTFKLTTDAKGYVMGGCGITALRQTSGFAAQTSPAFDTTPQFVGGQVTCALNGVILPAKTFTMEINNNMELDDFQMGSVFRADLTEKRREVKMDITYRPQDSQMWKAAMYGSSSLTSAAAGPAFQGTVQIKMNSFETIGNVVSGTPFSITIDVPVAVVAPFKVNPAHDDVIQTDLTIHPVRPDSNAALLTVTIQDDLATIV